LKVEVLEPNRALVLHGVMSPFTAEIVDTKEPATHAFFDWTWAFVLDQITPLMTRLIVRVRGNYKPDALRVVAPVLLEPMHFVMERGMLQGIKGRRASKYRKVLTLERDCPDATAAAGVGIVSSRHDRRVQCGGYP